MLSSFVIFISSDYIAKKLLLFQLFDFLKDHVIIELCHFTLCMLGKNFSRHFEIFFLIFPESRL